MYNPPTLNRDTPLPLTFKPSPRPSPSFAHPSPVLHRSFTIPSSVQIFGDIKSSPAFNETLFAQAGARGQDGKGFVTAQRYSFGTLASSSMILFQITVGNNWNDVMYPTIRATNRIVLAPLFFSVYFFLCTTVSEGTHIDRGCVVVACQRRVTSFFLLPPSFLLPSVVPTSVAASNRTPHTHHTILAYFSSLAPHPLFFTFSSPYLPTPQQGPCERSGRCDH